MNPTLLWISWGIVALASLLAARLTHTAVRARSLPEWLMALFFWGGAPFGYGLLLMRPTFDLTPEAFAPFLQASSVGFLLPAVTVVLFTWKVFRPGAAWAAALAVGISTLHVLNLSMAQWLAAPLGLAHLFSVEPGSAYYWYSAALRASGFLWACLEALLYYRTARKRLAIGLGDPIVVNRFVLWALWSGGATGLTVLRILGPFVADYSVEPPATPLYMILMSILSGLVCASAIWLTFAPPKPYLRWVTGSADR